MQQHATAGKKNKVCDVENRLSQRAEYITHFSKNSVIQAPTYLGEWHVVDVRAV